MRYYRWQATNRQGERESGLSPAPNRQLLGWQLIRQHLHLKTCRQLPQRLHRAGFRRRWLSGWLHQWATLLEAGFDLHSSLQLLFRHSRCRLEATALAHLQQAVNRGEAIATALAQSPLLFPTELRQRIGLAETTGNLPQVLRALARQSQQQEQERSALLAALRYPAFVLVLSLALLGFALLFLLPRFGTMYAQLEAPLPTLTVRLLALPDQLTATLLLTVSSLTGLVLGAVIWLWQTGQRYRLSCQLLYQLPGLNVEQRHFRLDATGLLLSLQAGLPLAQACQLTAEHSHSVLWATRWQQLSQQLLQGRSFTRSLAHFPVPELVLEYCHLGEVSGYLPKQLELVLQQLATREEQQRQRWLTALPTATLLLVATLTMILLLALYLPLFQLGQALG